MRPQAPRPRDPAARLLAARPFPSDNRKIHLPEEIPVAFQTGYHRFEAGRPSSVDAQRRQQHLDNGFVADGTSYYPRIRETSSSRETREQKIRTVANSVYELPALCGKEEAIIEPHNRKRSLNGVSTALAGRKVSGVPFMPSRKLLDFDFETMNTLQSAFEGCEMLSEEEFMSKMITQMDAELMLRGERTQLMYELKLLFRTADVNGSGELSWEMLSSHIFRLADHGSREHDNPTCSYKADDTVAPVNFSYEIEGMFYFPDADQVFLHSERQSSFWMMDVESNRVVRQALSALPTGQIVDAIYWPAGKYIITSSSSPVISFYDVDYLKLRQQIPCSGSQTALAGHADPSVRRLYSSNTDGQVHVWNLDSLSCSHSFFAKTHSVCTEMAVVDPMDQLAAACLDGKIYMIDLHVRQTAKTLCGHRQGVTILRYSAESGYLISGGVDQNIHIWNPHVETRIGSLLGHNHQLIGVEAIPNSSQLVSADESGIVKIWDLRKFSCLQTISREAYVKAGDLRTRTRKMKAMSYLASKRQIAIANSSIYFLNDVHTKSTDDVIRRAAPVLSVSSCRENRRRRRSSSMQETVLEYHEKINTDALKLPLAVIIVKHVHTIVAITGHHIICWDLLSGSLLQCIQSGLKDEITSATEIEDQYSCFVGTEHGAIVCLTLPGAAIVAHKKIVDAEIVTIRWVSGVRYLACSLGGIGNILVVQSDTLTVLFTLNHWRGAHTIKIQPQLSSELELSVPVRLRNFFHPGELKWLASLFLSTNKDTRSNTVNKSEAIKTLDSAIPSPSNQSELPKRMTTTSYQIHEENETISFAEFLDEAMKRIDLLHADRMPQSHRGIASLDANASLLQLLSSSTNDGTFCVWNLRNGAVTMAGNFAKQSCEANKNLPPASDSHTLDHSIAHVRYLEPLPYFIMITGGSQPRISVWSSASTTTLGNHFQCVLERSHAENSHAPKEAAISESIIEPAFPIITTLEWIFVETDNVMLIAVGDDRGIITIYNFWTVYETLTASATNPTLTKDRSSILLDALLLPISYEWKTNESTPFRSLSFTPLSVGGVNVSLILVSDSGSISFWKVDGQCLGRLSDTLHLENPRVASEKTHWKLGSIARRQTGSLLRQQNEQTTSPTEDSDKLAQRRAFSQALSNAQRDSLALDAWEGLAAPEGKVRAQRNAILSQLVRHR